MRLSAVGTGLTRWVAVGLLLGGCSGPASWQAARDAEVEAATRALAGAGDDAARARAHTARARAYSEKARYGRITHTLAEPEWTRLFDLAIVDHDRAVALADGDAAVHMARGRTCQDRAGLAPPADAAGRRLRECARADFTRVLEREPRNAEALDLRGLASLADGDLERAIVDFTAELELDADRGRLRLAESYCLRGRLRQQAGHCEQAVVDYERSLSFEAATDDCECQADTPLAWCYLDLGRGDDARRTIERARRAGRSVAPELLERLAAPPGS